MYGKKTYIIWAVCQLFFLYLLAHISNRDMMKHKTLFRFVAFLFLFVYSTSVRGDALRQFTSHDGLTNSAILSISQTEDGLLWIGTCDGLNIYDGKNLTQYSSGLGGQRLSGNLINGILNAQPDILWVQTNYGLDCIDLSRGQI